MGMGLEPRNANEEEIFAIEELIFDVQHEFQLMMQRRGMTQSQLAKAIGCSPARVSQLMNDAGANMTLETVARVAFALCAKVNFARALATKDAEATVKQKVNKAENETIWQLPTDDLGEGFEHKSLPVGTNEILVRAVFKRERPRFHEAANLNGAVAQPDKERISA